MADESDAARVQFRRPVALAVINDGRVLATANSRSGTISLVDLKDRKVIAELLVGKRLSDIVVTSNPERVLATDEESHELISVRLSPTECRVEKRLTVSPYPVTVRLNESGSRAYVASLWSKSIAVVDASQWISGSDDSKAILHRIELPFSPREMLVVSTDDQTRLLPSRKSATLKLIVADAFGSKLAVVDPESGLIESIREIPAHAIRAIRLHPTKPRVFLTHQLLSQRAHTTFDDVHWGNLMLNCLRSLDLGDLLDPKADLMKKTHVEFLGGPDKGAGDPGGFTFKLNSGTSCVALSGTDEVIIDEGGRQFNRRLKTEHCPTAVIIHPDGRSAFVANTLSDSVTIVGLGVQEVADTISLGPHPDDTAVERGEKLFRSARLSHDNWLSCSSCHVDGHTNGLLNDNMTDGSFETAKRVLTLRGVADTAPYAWSGRFGTLAEQIAHSVQSTMQGERLEDNQTADLEAFLRTLPAPPSMPIEDKGAVERGEVLFQKLNCTSCHSKPAFTSTVIVDVKLNDERGVSKFNPPSLRGVPHNGPYFHDGRASTLDAVFSKIRHQLDGNLANEEISDLIAYLSSL